MGKIKILQFSLANGNGGRTQYALNNWKYIDKEKFLFDFVTFNNEYALEDELNKQGCRVHHFTCYRTENEGEFITEWKQILKQGYDVVHLNTSYWDSMILEEVAMDMRIPKVIIHSHNSGIGTATDSQTLERLTNRHYEVRNMLNEYKATDFWACSKEAAEWLYGDRISNKRIKIMKNAISLENFEFDNENRRSVRNRLGIADSDFVVGNVGRFVVQKNQSFLIQVIAECVKKNKKIKLILRGEGALKWQLETMVNDMGITDNVLFLPHQRHMKEIYEIMDVLAMPSLFEGLSVCFLEAQANGLESICSKNLSKEADCTNTIKYLPLASELWVDEILERAKSVKQRHSNYEVMKAMGYDIRDQIKVIEKEYESL